MRMVFLLTVVMLLSCALLTRDERGRRVRVVEFDGCKYDTCLEMEEVITRRNSYRRIIECVDTSYCAKYKEQE